MPIKDTENGCRIVEVGHGDVEFCGRPSQAEGALVFASPGNTEGDYPAGGVVFEFATRTSIQQIMYRLHLLATYNELIADAAGAGERDCECGAPPEPQTPHEPFCPIALGYKPPPDADVAESAVPPELGERLRALCTALEQNAPAPYVAMAITSLERLLAATLRGSVVVAVDDLHVTRTLYGAAFATDCPHCGNRNPRHGEGGQCPHCGRTP